MAKRLLFLPEVYSEIEDIRDWYTEQNPPIADRFLSALEATLSTIETQPLRGAFRDDQRKFRFRRVGKFPYLAVYRVDAESILIAADYHASRRPNFWKERLKG